MKAIRLPTRGDPEALVYAEAPQPHPQAEEVLVHIGITGIAKAQVGDLLSPSSGTLTPVSTVDPIKVYFTASEQAYLNFVQADVSQYGLTTRKSTGLPMLIISLFSPHKTYDALFLANYATININDVFYRAPGVGEVRLFGASDYAMRIWVKHGRAALG